MSRRPFHRRWHVEATSLTLAGAGTLLAWSLSMHAPSHTRSGSVAAAQRAPVASACPDGAVGGRGRVEPTPAFVEQVCRLAGGETCEFPQVIPRRLALCVAEQRALGRGNAYRATLGYDVGAEIPIWRVTEAPGWKGGARPCVTTMVTVDARSGALVETQTSRDPFCSD